MIDAIGVRDGVDVGKGIGVLVETIVNVEVKVTMGVCVIVGCTLASVGFEEQPIVRLMDTTNIKS